MCIVHTGLPYKASHPAGGPPWAQRADPTIITHCAISDSTPPGAWGGANNSVSTIPEPATIHRATKTYGYRVSRCAVAEVVPADL